MAQTVIGFFDNASEAQQAVEQLVSNGFSRASIDIAASSGSTGSMTSSGTNDYGTSAGTSNYGTSTGTSSYNDNDGFGDKVSRFFSNLFDSDDDRNRYSTVASRSTTVTVHATSVAEAERAADLLDRYGAVDVDERASQYGYGATGATTAATSTTDTSYVDTTNRTADTTGAIPIIEENINVGKRVVETGGVRLRSRIIERPVEEAVRLRVEHVHVERNPVNRPATEADLNSFREGTIEAREQAEVPVVGKTARVVEEVRLDKEVEERDEVVRDTVRRTDVDVENLGTTNRTTDYDRTDTDRTNLNRSDYDRNPLDDDASRNRPGSL
jgi:stress response protein YsnF